MSLQGKVVLITGAADGIGFATARELLRNNIQGVVLADINETLGQKSLKKLTDEFSPERVIFKKVDVTNEDDFEGAFKETINTFGHVDIVFNNAGIVNETDYIKTINVNLIGTLRGTILGLKYMSKENGGSGGVILNASSMAALSTSISPVYSATKYGVLGLSRVYGTKLYYDKTNVRVIALCPGVTETKLVYDYKPEDEYTKKTWDIVMNHHPKQKVESVVKAALYAITKAESGMTCVINAGKLYNANIPDWDAYCELIDENL